MYLHGDITVADWGCADIWWLMSSSLEFDDVLKPVLCKRLWFMMIDSAGLKKKELTDLMSEVKEHLYPSIRTKAWKYENCKILQHFCTFHLWLSVAVNEEKKFKWSDHWMEIQLFCYIIYFQVMGNEKWLAHMINPFPYDAIFSNNWWSVAYCLVFSTGSRLVRLVLQIVKNYLLLDNRQKKRYLAFSYQF